MSPKQDSVAIRIELFKEADGRSGFTLTMDGVGGCGYGGMDHQTALLKAYQLARKELKTVLETKEERSARIDKAKQRGAALRKSREKGTL